MMRLKNIFVITMLAHFGAVACTKKDAKNKAPETPVAAAGAVMNSKEGVGVEDLVVGQGAVAVNGQKVSVHYTGWLESKAAADGKGKKFDSSLDRGEPFSFGLGSGMVIRGWDVGVEGMKVGGKRKLTIPADKAYGDRDVGGGLIPAGSTLVFEVELLGVGA